MANVNMTLEQAQAVYELIMSYDNGACDGLSEELYDTFGPDINPEYKAICEAEIAEEMRIAEEEAAAILYWKDFVN